MFVVLYDVQAGALLAGLMLSVFGMVMILRQGVTVGAAPQAPAEAPTTPEPPTEAVALDNIFERFRSQHQLLEENKKSSPSESSPESELMDPFPESDTKPDSTSLDPLSEVLQDDPETASPKPTASEEVSGRTDPEDPEDSAFARLIDEEESESENEVKVSLSADSKQAAAPKTPEATEPPGEELESLGTEDASAQASAKEKPTLESLASLDESMDFDPDSVFETESELSSKIYSRPVAKSSNAVQQEEEPPSRDSAPATPAPAVEKSSVVVPELVELSDEDLFGDEEEDDLFADARFTLPAEEPGKLPEGTNPMPRAPRVSGAVPKKPAREERVQESDLLLNSAKKAFAEERWEEARVNLENYRTVMKRLQLEPTREALELQTQVNLREGNTEQASEAFEEYRAQTSASGSEESIRLMEELSRSLERKKAYSEALPILQELLGLYREQEDWLQVHSICERQEVIFEAGGDEAQLLEVLKIHREAKRALKDRFGESQLLDRIGTLYHQRGDLEASRRYYEENLKLRTEQVG